MFAPVPCVYMEKIAGNSEIADVLSLDEPLTDVIAKVAERKDKDVGDVTVIMLDRPRHQDKVAEIREAELALRPYIDPQLSAAGEAALMVGLAGDGAVGGEVTSGQTR